MRAGQHGGPRRIGRYAFDAAAREAGGFPHGFAVPLPCNPELEQLLLRLRETTRAYREASQRMLEGAGRRRR